MEILPRGQQPLHQKRGFDQIAAIGVWPHFLAGRTGKVRQTAHSTADRFHGFRGPKMSGRVALMIPTTESNGSCSCIHFPQAARSLH